MSLVFVTLGWSCDDTEAGSWDTDQPPRRCTASLVKVRLKEMAMKATVKTGLLLHASAADPSTPSAM